jgi:hypothetical protein
VNIASLIRALPKVRPLRTWADGSLIFRCAAWHSKEDALIYVVFLGREIVSRGGNTYWSWAINDEALKNIRKATLQDIYIGLEKELKEPVDRLNCEGRLFRRKKFLRLIDGYGRRPVPGGDFTAVGEFDLSAFQEHPDGHPDRAAWVRC